MKIVSFLLIAMLVWIAVSFGVLILKLCFAQILKTTPDTPEKLKFERVSEQIRCLESDGFL